MLSRMLCSKITLPLRDFRPTFFLAEKSKTEGRDLDSRTHKTFLITAHAMETRERTFCAIKAVSLLLHYLNKCKSKKKAKYKKAKMMRKAQSDFSRGAGRSVSTTQKKKKRKKSTTTTASSAVA
ncbi:hypothetical protein TSAR_000807 [Trichomalopsis sarcophagae]|uniref:Uncharacterized protein n=1 Tax=Trichomalopsis sarcophagae TaxID=543379 RepID=A0A232FLT3_9HYME|nr:hypothetical protein TSAR_000807 [Trichomalopsis sarcophagae]